MGLTDSIRETQARAAEFNSARVAEQCAAVLREPTPPFRLSDEEREVLIRFHAKSIDDAAMGSPLRRAHWERMRDLIEGRSQRQIETMERAAGLRE